MTGSDLESGFGAQEGCGRAACCSSAVTGILTDAAWAGPDWGLQKLQGLGWVWAESEARVKATAGLWERRPRLPALLSPTSLRGGP